MTHLNLLETAEKLKISKASVRNWEKHGYLSSINGKYEIREINDLLEKIERGDIKRLKSRANKATSRDKFIPTEYIDSDSVEKVVEITQFITGYNIRPEQALFLLTVNIFNKSGEFLTPDLTEVVSFKDSTLFKRESLYCELKKWFSQISNKPIDVNNKYCNYLLFCGLPKGRDILGVIYQSITREGKKSNLGSYYTPRTIVENLLSREDLNFSKVLDPCCGTGQFLLEIAEKVNDPSKIWGCDIDPIAAQIARINLFNFYNNLEFSPNIFPMNSLIDFNEDGFTLIATNPPWGAKIPVRELKLIKKRFPLINSKESFSFFMNMSIEKLVKGGFYLFVLPTSFLYVKNHSDIRSLILNNSSIEKITSYGRAFKKVFSSVVTIEGINGEFREPVSIGNDYIVSQNRFLSNYNSILNIETDNSDQAIIDKVFSFPNITLKDNANWALGIVTGNNSKYLKDEMREGLKPIYRGRDLVGLDLERPVKYIEYNRENFQQCAPDRYYFAPEKLIYKFISDRLCFSYDNMGSLTLNSANIMIPSLGNYKVKSIGAILNSNLYNFIFRKIVNPLKILRGDLEMLPFPILDSRVMDEVDREVDKTGVIDNLLYKIFNLTEKEVSIIENLFS